VSSAYLANLNEELHFPEFPFFFLVGHRRREEEGRDSETEKDRFLRCTYLLETVGFYWLKGSDKRRKYICY
jgi:hypothetical protein